MQVFDNYDRKICTLNIASPPVETGFFPMSLAVINNSRKNPVSAHLSIIWGGKKLGMRNTC